MEYERKGVTITWLIENVECIDKLYSPVIFLDEMDGTKWRIMLFRMCREKVSLSIKRENEDNGPEELGLHYEFFVNDCPCPYSTQKRMTTFIFQRGEPGNVISGWTQQTGSLEKMTIRCKVWRLWGSIPKSSHFSVRTRLKKESYISKGKIEQFSKFSDYEQKTLKTVFLETDEKDITVNLSLFPLSARNFDSIIEIEIIPMSRKAQNFLIFHIFIFDSSGNKTDIGKVEKQLRLKESVKFVLPNVSKEYIMENSDQYLVNDALSLQCEFFWSEIEYEDAGRTEYKIDSYSEEKQEEFSKKVRLLTSKECIPYDTKLQTDTETFPTHTTILSAQSPVFEAMFRSNMKETIQKYVRIDDVDAETVKHMLVFLYSGTLEELEWMGAMELYVAAQKYQILTLKGRCSDFLKQSIDLSNCCVLLILADIYQDEDMARAVKAFISEYSSEVLYGDQWRSLERNHPNVAIQTFREMFLDLRYLETAVSFSFG